MIDAAEARKITGDAVANYLHEIELGIRKNAELGRYKYVHTLDADSSIVDAVAKHLKQHQYTVQTESNFGYDAKWRTDMIVIWGPGDRTSKEED